METICPICNSVRRHGLTVTPTNCRICGALFVSPRRLAAIRVLENPATDPLRTKERTK